MTERGTSLRISNAARSNTMDFYSVIGNVTCSSSNHIHLDHVYTGYKAEVATFYGCSWNGQSSYNEYLFYVYSSHGSGGYFALSYVNGSFTATGPIFAYASLL